MPDKSMTTARKIRLCVIATVPISIIAFNGRQIDFLADRGFDITVITSGDRRLEERISKKAHLVIVPLTRVVSPVRDVLAFMKIFQCLRRGSFDIVQYSSPKAALVGSLAAWACRVPVRLYLMWGLYYAGQEGFKRSSLKFIEKVVCFLSTQVSPDSYGNLEFAVQEGLCPGSKISVVGQGSANGVDLDRFDPERLKSRRVSVRHDLRIPHNAWVIGFVGRLRRDKGINELVRAFIALKKKYHPIYLLLVGPQENKASEYEPDVNAAVSEDDCILRVGYQSCPEDYMAAMDIFVLPSYREGFGVANIEASAMELPVVSTNIPGPRDAVLDGKTGILIPVKSVIPLQEAIAILIDDASLRQKMGEAGRQWAKNFEQQKLWDQILIHRTSLWQKDRHLKGKPIPDLGRK